MATELDSATLSQPRGWPRRFTIVLFFFTCALILYINRASISVAGPILMEEFGWDSATMGSSLSGFGALVWLLFASGEQVFE